MKRAGKYIFVFDFKLVNRTKIATCKHKISYIWELEKNSCMKGLRKVVIISTIISLKPHSNDGHFYKIFKKVFATST